jgi:PAS domain S-box-containing protein
LIQSILQSTKDAILIADKDGKIININEGFQEIFAWELLDLQGQFFYDIALIPEDQKPEVKGLYLEVLDGKQIRSFQTIRLEKSGNPIDVSSNFIPLFNE